MQRLRLVCIVLISAIFLLGIVHPLIYSQIPPSPTFKAEGHSLILGDIPDTQIKIYDKNGFATVEKRAEEIEQKIQIIANDLSIAIDDIQKEQGKIFVNTVSNKIEILSITDLDAKISNQRKETLANNYLYKIKIFINKYRNANRKYTVFIENRPIFIVPANTKIYDRETRAHLITNRLQNVINDSSLEASRSIAHLMVKL